MEELLNKETAAPAEKKKWKPHMPKSKRGKRWLKVLVVLVIAAAVVAGCVANAKKNLNSQLGGSYLVETAARRELTVSVSGTATLEPADSYNITTLLSGEIQEAPFEEGDLVSKDTLLYVLDSSDVQSNVDLANISVAKAELACQQAQDALNPKAGITGTISEVLVRNGESVSDRTPLCKIVASTDLSVDFLFPYAAPSDFYVGQSATLFIDGMAGTTAGTVSAVSNSTAITSDGRESASVRVTLANPGVVADSFTCSAVIGSYCSYGSATIKMAGASTVYASGAGTVAGFGKLVGSTVTKGETLCTVESESNRDQVKNAQLNLKSAQLSAETTADNLDDYNIEAPIAGTVIEKNFKAGDKVEGMNSGNLAVIYDLSYLKLEMGVDELDIGKVELGQTVEITADALPGETFTGVVDKISISGTTSSGATSYPVTIIIENYGDLKPGMNVSAKIIGEKAGSVLCIPVDAVSRGNEVTVPGEGAMNEDNTAVADITKLETKEVGLGRNDEEYIEVTDGLEEGDIVLIANQSSSVMAMMGAMGG